MFGPPQPAASTKAFSAVESSSTSDPSAAAQNLASASASAASNDTDLITLGTLGKVAPRALPRHLDLPASATAGPPHAARLAPPQAARGTHQRVRSDRVSPGCRGAGMRP